jgi:general secretion pathway protein D
MHTIKISIIVLALSGFAVFAHGQATTGDDSGIVGAPLVSPIDQSLQQTLDKVRVNRTKEFMKQVSPPAPSAKPKVQKNDSGIMIGPDTRFIVGNQNEGKAKDAVLKQAVSSQEPKYKSNLKGKFDGKNVKKIKFNFQNAKASVVIDFIAKLFGLVPVVDPALNQKQITLYSPEEVSIERAYAIFSAVLNNMNYAVVRVDGFLKIVDKKNAPQSPLKIFYGNDPDALPDSDEMITQLLPCQNVSALELMKYFKPLLSTNTGANSIAADPEANLLIISDIASNVQRMLKLARYLDVPGRHQFNNLVTSVYYINYLKAKDLAVCLTNTFNVKSSVTVRNNNVVNNQIIIQPFLDSNALLITARPDLQKAVGETIKKLDKRKKQVLLKVKFLEATYGRDFNFGTDLIFKSGQFTKGGNSVNKNSIQVGPESDVTQNLLGEGNDPQFAYIFRNNSVDFTIQALLEKNNVKVLSHPRILTADNEKATLLIGNQKPILKSTTDVSQSGNTVSDFSYINIGITLNITPHINPEKDVTMEMDFKISNIDGYDTFPPNNSLSVPILANRETKTTVTVKHDHTLVIGGIVSKNHTETQNSVPWFGDVPVLGWLFGDESESSGQTELIILVSPYVVEDSKDGDALTTREKDNVIVSDEDFKDFKKYFIRKKDEKTINQKISNFFKANTDSDDSKGEDKKSEDKKTD